MLGPPKVRDLDRPVLISLEATVPLNHFYRHLHRVLDLSFDHNHSAIVLPSYNPAGDPTPGGAGQALQSTRRPSR